MSLELHGFGFGLWRFGWQHLLDFPRRYATGSCVFVARGVFGGKIARTKNGWFVEKKRGDVKIS